MKPREGKHETHEVATVVGAWIRPQVSTADLQALGLTFSQQLLLKMEFEVATYFSARRFTGFWGD